MMDGQKNILKNLFLLLVYRVPRRRFAQTVNCAAVFIFACEKFFLLVMGGNTEFGLHSSCGFSL